jgi:hypothetical protein
MSWTLFAYRLVLLALGTYAIWLVLGMYVVPAPRRQQLIRRVYDNYRTLQEEVNVLTTKPEDLDPNAILVNQTDAHAYAHFYRQYHKLLSQFPKSKLAEAVKDFEAHDLLRWARGNDDDQDNEGGVQGVVRSWRGDGLVLVCSSFTLRRTIHQLKTLKQHGSTLPVRVYYTWDGALDNGELKLLKEETGQVAYNLSDSLPFYIRRNVTTDVAKPFAAYFSPYARTVVADHEVVFVADPRPLLRGDLSEEKGAIFFRDRKLFPGNFELVRHVLETLPQPLSESVADGYWMQQRSSYQQDSSVVVVDKRVAFLGIIAAANLVLSPLKDTIRRRFENEKEAWWLGFEQARSPFIWEKIEPVSIGYLQSMPGGTTRVCGGHTLHYRGNGEPVWISGGYDRNTGPGGSPQPDTFNNVIDRTQAGQWHAQLCQDGEARGLEDLQAAMSILKQTYSSDYQWKYFEDFVASAH